MSDTPETDAQLTTFTSISKLKKHFVNRTGTVSAEFARKLERELREAREMAEELLVKNAKQAVEIIYLRAGAKPSKEGYLRKPNDQAVNVLV